MSAAKPGSTAANAILKITIQVFGITRTVLLYRLVQLALFPFIVLYLALRLIKNRAYRTHFGERLGFLPRCLNRTNSGSIWLHAVSVGEVASALPLIQTLRTAEPSVPVFLSTSTVAGRKAAEQRIGSLVEAIFYCPFDYVSCIRRTLTSIQPSLVIILETEIWPNLFAEVKRSRARLAIVNGRISNRTWPRYRSMKQFFAPIMRLPDLIAVQSAEDANRYWQLGCPPDTVHLYGNLKYDAAINAEPSDLPLFHAEKVWIAASTVGPNEAGSIKRHAVDEDDIVIGVFQELARDIPGLLLILAPRQPARFEAVAQKLDASGLPYVRRQAMQSDENAQLTLPGIVLLDTIGELASAFQLADVVFVGGSIAPRGGHNILEPAAAGAAIVIGPNMQNFEAITRDFKEAEAVVQIERAGDLASVVRDLLLNRAQAELLGQRARLVVERQEGAANRIAERLWPLYRSAWFIRPRPALVRLALSPLAWLWRYGGAEKRRRGQFIAASHAPLPVPVISVGGITVGGSGKTPFTNYLTSCLRKQGHAPAILTRGYRRRSPAENIILPRGAQVSSALTGDEAQIFLRAGNAVIGVGSDRYETAKLVLRHHPKTDVFVLDDGFQHARLRRDLDIVLIDGLDPFGRFEVVPLGRLREPLSSLSRAQVFVVTRADHDGRYQALRSELHRLNPDAEIFRTRLLTRRWRNYSTGEQMDDLGARRVAAFCGLGNPQSFWSTLEALGLEIVFRWEFHDHFAYRPTDLQRLAHQAQIHGAEILVTTEKDRANCPDHLETAMAPLDLAWLEIEFELEDAERFFSLLTPMLLKPENRD